MKMIVVEVGPHPAVVVKEVEMVIVEEEVVVEVLSVIDQAVIVDAAVDLLHQDQAVDAAADPLRQDQAVDAIDLMKEDKKIINKYTFFFFILKVIMHPFILVIGRTCT